jgi:hypothetical protein
MSDESSFLNVGVIFIIGLLMLYILIAHMIERNKVDFLHESGVAILMGALAGLLAFTVSINIVTISNKVSIDWETDDCVF